MKKKDRFCAKVMHGYLRRKTGEIEGIDQVKSLLWSTDHYLTSEFEGYIHAIQEQEISTKYLVNKRELDSGKPATSDNKCRLCRRQVEDISHVIGNCEKMSSRYYLPLRHDVVAKTIWNEITGGQSSVLKQDEFIEVNGYHEYWWNLKIKTGTKLKHNRPDIVVWNHEIKTCIIVEVSCPLDVNVVRKVSEKENIYGPLLRNLQMQYPTYRFSFIPIIVGATGYIATSLYQSIRDLGFLDKDINRIIHKIQMNSISGTVKICKTFMKFKT